MKLYTLWLFLVVRRVTYVTSALKVKVAFLTFTEQSGQNKNIQRCTNAHVASEPAQTVTLGSSNNSFIATAQRKVANQLHVCICYGL